MFKLDLEKAEEPEIKLPTSTGTWKAIEFQKNIYFCFIDLGSIVMNKSSDGDGIPAKLFQILKDDTIKVLHSICQQIWKFQQ